MSKKNHYKSIFISDVHLGTRGCKADRLNYFLKENTSENLFLIGDIIDGWRLSKRWHFPQEHTNIIRRILTNSKNNVNVYYIIGNHDEFARKFLSYDLKFGNIQVLNELRYDAANGKTYLIIHGDQFDQLMFKAKWLMHLGDSAYNLMVWINMKMNGIRNMFGYDYWSLSKWLKQNTKQALDYIYKFEEIAIEYCKKHNYDGIFCGHIHAPMIKDIDGIEYFNTGDWVEECTAIVEHFDGTFELINYDR